LLQVASPETFGYTLVVVMKINQPLLENPIRKYHVRDLGVGGRMILKYIVTEIGCEGMDCVIKNSVHCLASI
jgi:hypothetical protein